MKKIVYFTVLLFLVLIPKDTVKASCDNSEIVRLQRIASNVNISYTFDEKVYKFKIIFTNLTSEIIMEDVDSSRTYNTNKELTIEKEFSGNYRFNVRLKNEECGIGTTTRYVKLPYYNTYFNSEMCDGIEDYSYCLKWLENSSSNDIIYKKISQYKKMIEEKKETTKNTKTTLEILKEYIVKYYTKYYYIILPVIIISLGIVIVIKNRKNQLV